MPFSHPLHTEPLWQDLERRILHGLACEWQATVDALEPSLQRQLRMPLFRLGGMATRLGQYTSGRNEICLGRAFAMKHPWHAVLEVLRHEMAHQIADRVLSGRDEKPHGPAFREACRLLRIDPAASARYQPIDREREGDPAAVNDRILMRVQKLLALAESGNRHEAEAAMAKAHLLLMKYNIDRIRSHAPREYGSVFLGVPALRHFREAYHLAALIQDYYFVQGIWVSSYVLSKGKMGKVLEISGTRSNIDIAAYVYDYIHNYIDRHWRRYNRHRRLNRYRKTDFAIGVIEGFREKMADGKQRAASSEERSLVRIGDSGLALYMRFRYPFTRTFRRQAANQDDQVIGRGMDAGRRLVISRGITTSEKSGRMLEQRQEPGR
jgi:hypothetical protein